VHDLGEGLSQLLHDPGTGGMFGDVEVQDVATAVADHEKQYRSRKVAVGTVKKSRAAMASRRFLRLTSASAG